MSKENRIAKLLNDAMEEHRDLLEETGMSDVCWYCNDNNSIVQLLHQTKVKLEISMEQQYTVNDPNEEVIWLTGPGRPDYTPEKDEVIRFLGFTGSLAELCVMLIDSNFREVRIPAFQFSEEYFNMMQRGKKDV